MSEIEAAGPNVFERISAVMADVGVVEKKGRNDFQDYNYATEADFIHAVRPLLLKHGLAFILQSQELKGITPIVKDSKETGKFLTSIVSTYRVVNILDPKDSCQIQVVGQGVDAGDKGVYKAVTGAKKYALANTFLIATGDDPEKDNASVKSKKASSNVSDLAF